MTRKIVLSLTIVAAVAAAGRLQAATLESAAAQAFSMVPLAMAERQAALTAAQNEFQKLAAAFEKGAAPKKEELAGWRAGKIFDKQFPADPGSVLLAASGDKFVALVLYAGSTFYENMDADLAAGVKVFIDEDQKRWTAPNFAAAGVAFERILPEYEKGFSRYEVRKTADGRVLLKHVWQSELGGSVSSGTEYAFFTKDVTPR
jgi:hypothetical protein